MTGDEPQHPRAEDFASGVRSITVDGDRWIARLAGSGAAGSGAFGLAMIESIEFAPADSPAKALRETLLQRGRFELLHDAELVALFHAALPLTKRRSLEDTN